LISAADQRRYYFLQDNIANPFQLLFGEFVLLDVPKNAIYISCYFFEMSIFDLLIH